MQTPTHMVAGVLIQKAIPGKNRKVALAIVAIVAFLSHGFLDKLAQITFHPADPDFHSIFWVTYHSILLVTAIIFGVIFWGKYKWGMVFANLPDVDWIFIHGQEIFHCKIPFYRQPHMHHFLGYIYDNIPPFSYVTHWINQLPNERHNPWACLCEVVLVSLMFVVIWLLNLIRSYQPANRAEESKKQSTSTPT